MIEGMAGLNHGDRLLLVMLLRYAGRDRLGLVGQARINAAPKKEGFWNRRAAVSDARNARLCGCKRRERKMMCSSVHSSVHR